MKFLPVIILAIVGSTLSLPQIRRRLTSTTPVPKVKESTVELNQLLQDPNFGTFLEELHNRFNDVQKKTTSITTSTTTPEPTTPEVTTPFFPRFFQQASTQHPRSHILFGLEQQHSLNKIKSQHISQRTSTTTPHPLSLVEFQRTTPSTTPQPIRILHSVAQSRPDLQEPIRSLPEPQQPIRSLPEVLQPIRSLPALAKPRPELEEQIREQARSAKYEFASKIDDTISDQSSQREEVRDGLKVRGKYSYSDGYFLRTVEYEADEQGYRVLNQTAEKIGNGPEINPNGNARIATYVAGNAVNYEITGEDIKGSSTHQQVFQQEQ